MCVCVCVSFIRFQLSFAVNAIFYDHIYGHSIEINVLAVEAARGVSVNCTGQKYYTPRFSRNHFNELNCSEMSVWSVCVWVLLTKCLALAPVSGVGAQWPTIMNHNKFVRHHTIECVAEKFFVPSSFRSLCLIPCSRRENAHRFGSSAYFRRPTPHRHTDENDKILCLYAYCQV